MAFIPLVNNYLHTFIKSLFTYLCSTQNNISEKISHLVYLKIVILKRIKWYQLLCKLCNLSRRKKLSNKYIISTVAAYASELEWCTLNEINNFEYDDNEWDVEIRNLIVDLDADIEKTRNEKFTLKIGMASTPSSSFSNHQIQKTDNLILNCSDSESHSSCSQVSCSSSQSSTNLSVVTCNISTQNINLTNISNTNSNSSPISSNIATTHSNVSGNQSGKMVVEHSATVDKGLKMKIKRTKPGTKSSEIKHEIVKPNEANGSLSVSECHNVACDPSSNVSSTTTASHSLSDSTDPQCFSSNKSKSSHTLTSIVNLSNVTFVNTKRTSNSHRRDKGRDKHERLINSHTSDISKTDLNISAVHSTQSQINSLTFSSITTTTSTSTINSSTNNQAITSTASNSSSTLVPAALSTIATIGINKSKQQQFEESVVSSITPFQISQCNTKLNELPNCVPVYSSTNTSSVCLPVNVDTSKCSTNVGIINSAVDEEPSELVVDSPPSKKIKSMLQKDVKEMSDVCVGTSVGTITEPDCLGPCEPGTTVQLEGIVWHETEGGVLVVNITWRGKTYVGTLLDCTRHDWAPPRFCDSPTSDLDSRMPKGRTKRGRAAAHIITNNDFSNFTETRSSVHSKLRNTATKSRRATHGSPANSPSSCAFVSPRIDVTTKRKTKFLEEDDKCKRRLPSQIPSYISPSSSPVLLECPDPNCSKKYKHINGLKYHQSHAHGSTDDDDTKELIISMSENDESNTDAPSPITLVKSPSEKLEDTSTRLTSPTTNISETLLTERAITIHVELPEVINKSPVASEHTVIKPALLRFDNENSKILVESVTSLISPTNSPSENKCSILQENSPLQYDRSHLMVSPTLQHQEENPPFQSEQNKCIKQSNSPIVSVFSIATQSIDHSTQGLNTQTLQDFQQNVLHTSHSSQHLNNPSVGSKIIDQNIINNFPDLKVSNTSIDHTSSSKIISDNPTHLQSFSDINPSTKIPQFKVKPTAALMPEHDRNKELKMCKTSSLKKKYRKSPRSSPQQSLLEATSIDNERDEVQSPAYSDISDDATPIDESNFCDKHLKSNHEKELKSNSENHLTTHFSMYPYFSQSSYLLENIQEKSSHECRINELSSKNDLKSLNIVSIPALSNYQNLNSDKDKKDSITTQINPQQQGHYYTNYNPYMSGFSFQSQTGNSQTMNQLSETEFINQKNKKDEQLISNSKDKHFDNHQVLKESVEMKSQINPYQIYHHSQRPSQISTILPDDRRFYIYTGEQRRKEEIHKQNVVQKSPTQSLKQQIKPDKLQDSNKNDEAKIKQEGVKPTMETQGPPPPPTSQYTYIHPGYIPPHHYGSISYDTGHPGIYRNLTPMIVPSAYANNPYLHQLPRYHTPEDLSRPPSGKALDILQHHANQYYSAHKIHELQERALKSPTPKTAVSSSPSVPPISIRSPNSSSNSTPGTSSSQTQTIRQQSQNSNQQHATCGDSTTSLNKDNRSPPPQRHVHTHHHTHVGLGYPILPGQYPAPYGAVLSSQQAAAVAASVISPFPPK